MINRQVLEDNWNEIKERLRCKWAQLSDAELPCFQGNVDELIGEIQRKTGEGREAVEQFLHELTDSAAAAVRERLAEAKRLVGNRPGQSLAVCFGAGLIVGLLVAMTLRRK